ncbi:MAG: serine/threonine-protein kinase [Cyanobacteria bacterium J06598_3]
MTAEPPVSEPSGPLLNHRYRIVRSLAEGSFGKTYLAEDVQMPSRRRCVIKQLKPVSGNPTVEKVVQQRFLREVAVLDAVGKTHPQIPTLYAYFSQAGQFYLVQEWIDGNPLLSMPQAVWSEEKVFALLQGVLPVLRHVHSQHVIHRDIKPGNILLNRVDGLPYVIDFGSVKELMSTVIASAGRVKSSIVIGTPGFMSPEQAAGRPTFASDLYSLGMTAIYLLTGRSPGEMPIHSHTGQLLWRQYAPRVGDGLAKVLSSAVSTNAQIRYRTAQDMSVALLPSSASVPFPAAIEPFQTPPLTVLQPVDTGVQSLVPSRSLDKRHNQTNLTGGFPVKTIVLVAGGLLVAVMAGVGRFVVSHRSADTSSADMSSVAQLEIESINSSANTSIEDASRSGEEATAQSKKPAVEQASALAYQQQAVDLYQQKRESQALEKIEAALSLQPNLVPALILKADILAAQTIPDMSGAIALYTQALRTTPVDATLLTKRCKAYANLQKWAEAEADCTQALERSPSDAMLHGRRGNIYSAQADYEAALQDYSEAIALNAVNGQDIKNQSLYYRRAEVFGKLERYEEAMADFEKMRSLTP